MAAGSSSSLVIDPPIFNGKDHFDHWQLQMKTFFQSQGLWNVIQTGLILTSTDDDDDDDDEEQQKNAHALYCIQRALAPTIFPKINNPNLSAKDAWDILDADYNFHPLNFIADEDYFHAIEIPETIVEETINISLPHGCIKVIPHEIRDLNPAAYNPQVISIGPLHHGKPHLVSKEKHKLEYANSFLEQTNKPKAFFVQFLQKHEQSIRNFYSEPCELDSRAYVDMILLDSFFILEVLHKACNLFWSFFIRDPLGADFGLLQTIMLDLLMFENQLPFLLLSKLHALSGREELPKYCTYFFLLILLPLKVVDTTFYSFYNSLLPTIINNTEHFHLTNIMRHIIATKRTGSRISSGRNRNGSAAKQGPRRLGGLFFNRMDSPSILALVNLGETPNFSDTPHLKNAAKKLSQSRVKFIWVLTPNLSDICFKKMSLHLPRLVVDNTTERYFRNLMGMEQSQFKDDAFICSYVRFLHMLIKSEDDVAVLVEANVIVNELGSSQAVVELLNHLCTNINVSYFHFSKICKDLDDYCSSWEGWWNNCVRILKNGYFSNLWIGTGTIGAVILLLLTLIQAITSILQVLHV